LVSKRRRLRRKDQAIAEVDSDKATLELPAEASGIITLKAEEGDAVAVDSSLSDRYSSC
jgi:pyruvate/2-oxoglutarate dehydrogenase complex dihydrolipoamide acyltransferase (E2) component